jgi:hypothetical protein
MKTIDEGGEWTTANQEHIVILTEDTWYEKSLLRIRRRWPAAREAWARVGEEEYERETFYLWIRAEHAIYMRVDSSVPLRETLEALWLRGVLTMNTCVLLTNERSMREEMDTDTNLFGTRTKSPSMLGEVRMFSVFSADPQRLRQRPVFMLTRLSEEGEESGEGNE